MFKYQLAAFIALSLLASCSSSSNPQGVAQVQEFNPVTSRWETTNRVVVPTQAQSEHGFDGSTKPAAAPQIAPDQSGSAPQKEGFFKRSLKWLPGVD